MDYGYVRAGNELAENDQIKQSELKYRRLFEASQDGILILDGENGEIYDANRFILDLLGYPLDYFIGKHLWELGFIRDKSFALKAFAELQKNSYIRYEDIPLEASDGRRLEVEFISNVYMVNSHKIIQCNIRDITDRKRVENALALTRMKLNLLSSVTRHDINNQLMTLSGFLGILHQEVRDPALEKYFIRIEDASSRIATMIRFTREYEQIGVNAPTWQDCRALVDAAVQGVSLGPITVKNDLPSETRVFADPLIIKVFFNLLDNALRYGKKITTIRFFLEEPNGLHVIVCEDDGEGVIPDEKERIFEQGFGKNTGLGLTFARDILSITGITIRETGTYGSGARFEMTVPDETFQPRKEPSG